MDSYDIKRSDVAVWPKADLQIALAGGPLEGKADIRRIQ
jgi:hypothetical protein